MLDASASTRPQLRRKLRTATDSLPAISSSSTPLTVDGTNIWPGDAFESDLDVMYDYWLVIDCEEDAIICYYPESDTTARVHARSVAANLRADYVVHHPQLID